MNHLHARALYLPRMAPPTPPSIPTGQTFTHFAYIPDLGANVLYICIFGFYLIVKGALVLKFRKWDYMCAMLCGVFLEVAVYTSRIFMRKYPDERTPFLMDNICLILGPAFLAASIYLCMGRIVVVYGRKLSRLSVSGISLLTLRMRIEGLTCASSRAVS